MSAVLGAQHHGKGKVRLGRTWREGDKHYFVEWRVQSMLESDMAHAYYQGSNKDMTATDTQKNTVGSVSYDTCETCNLLPKHAVKFWERTDILNLDHRSTTSQSNVPIDVQQKSMQLPWEGISSRTTPR